LTLPEQEWHTTAYWLTLPRDFLISLPYSADERQNGLRALKNALRSIATLLLMCDPRDLGAALGENDPEMAGEATALADSSRSQPLFEPNLYLYDNYPGGIGLAQPLYELHDELLEKTLALVHHCACLEGCPSCVGPVGEVGESGKRVAQDILARLVER
jgi:DEAD/DEAH box helicase domain-containing protein